MSKMNETGLTMPMKFEKTNFFIISPNLTVATHIVGLTASSSCNETAAAIALLGGVLRVPTN